MHCRPLPHMGLDVALQDVLHKEVAISTGGGGGGGGGGGAGDVEVSSWWEEGRRWRRR